MTRSRSLPVAALTVLAAMTAVAIAPVATEASSAPGTASVSLRNIRFSPSTVTIAHRGTVTWHWRDGDTSHNVAVRGFKRSATKQSGTFTVRFPRAGTYRYQCTVHPGMTGKVIVR
jgi:plastocyanin